MDRKNLSKILILFLATVVLVVITVMVPARKVTRQKAVLGSTAVSFQPTSSSLSIGEEKTIQLNLSNPSQKKVSFIDIRLTYDKDILEITNFSPNSEAFPINLTANDAGLLGASTGQAKLQAANSGTGLKNDLSILVGTIKIKGKAAGASSITVSEAASQIVGENTTGDDFIFSLSGSGTGSYTVNSGPTVTPQVTPTATPTPSGENNPTLNFRIKFQGVTTERPDQKVKVTVKKDGVDEEFSNINVTADDDGIYSGSIVLVDVPAGSGYKIFIKGPKHLAKKFCRNNQTSRCSGEGSIVLTNGDNEFNFATMVLEAGDLPDAGEQDGVVNSLDYSLWKSRYGREDNNSLVVADINFDGIVNTLDWDLMRITLETKYEEDN